MKEQPTMLIPKSVHLRGICGVRFEMMQTIICFRKWDTMIRIFTLLFRNPNKVNKLEKIWEINTKLHLMKLLLSIVMCKEIIKFR